MPPASKARKRARGEIETLPSGSLRVRVYAGVDPVSRKRHYLVETVPAGPNAARDAEKVRTRLLGQVDERRNPRTRATVSQLMARYLEVIDIEPTTRYTYEGYIRNHIRPLLGDLAVARLDERSLTRSMRSSAHAAHTAVAGGTSSTEPQGLTTATAGAGRTHAVRWRTRLSGRHPMFCSCQVVG